MTATEHLSIRIHGDDDAAVEAVRQWQYAPLILNGIPERFMLTVVLTFHLTEPT